MAALPHRDRIDLGRSFETVEGHGRGQHENDRDGAEAMQEYQRRSVPGLPIGNEMFSHLIAIQSGIGHLPEPV